MRRKGSFKCEVHFLKKYKYKTWDRPGLWCSDEELEEIRKVLIDIAERAQGTKDIPMYGPLLPGRENLSNKLITIAYHKKSGQAAGFSAQTHMELKNEKKGIKVIHLGLVYIDPGFQGKGMATFLYIIPNILSFLKKGLRPLWISSVSQVPAVVGLVSKSYGNVFPSPYNGEQTAEHFLIAREIMKNHRFVFGVGEDAIYDEESQIIKNAYTGGSDNLLKSFDESSKHRDDKINNFCKDYLDYERGDDYLQLGRLDICVLNSFLRDKVCESKLSLIVATICKNFIEFIFVPLIRVLFSTEKPGKIKTLSWKMR